MSRFKTRICVVCSDYGESNSPMKDVDDFLCTPENHCQDSPDFEFETLMLHKKDVYSKLRAAVTSGKFDVFFVIADGALDEDRAGIEVVQTLEKFGVAFTGARSNYFELSKPEMKVLALRNGIQTARFAVVDQGDDIARCIAASRLESSFPLIVKHVSGYSSVGMTKKNKVADTTALVECCREFCATYQQALVEEFVPGLEVTVLACGDSTQPDGIRVYPPVFVSFPEGEDFKHFDIKWVSYDDMQWKQLPDDHPAMAEICRVTRVAFRSMMDGVGYGRVDLRIEVDTNRVVFLEINPNCGMMYPVGFEASADFILQLANARSDFVRLQIREAIAVRDATRPPFAVRLDGTREQGWTTRATRAIAQGAAVLSLAGETDVKLIALPGGSCGSSRSDASSEVSSSQEDNNSNKKAHIEQHTRTGSSAASTPNSMLLRQLLDPASGLLDRGIATVMSVVPPSQTVASQASQNSPSNGSSGSPSAASTPVLSSHFSIALSDSKRAMSNIVGAVPFPKANGSAPVGCTSKQALVGAGTEVPNVVLDVEGLRFVALRDIAAGEELLL